MEIHVVQSGETLRSISEKYKIPVERLILENGITNPNNLVTGQAIVIIQPLVTHQVKEGDTLTSIADQYNVTTMDLLRNNPYLSDREVLYPGETIVISYDTNKSRQIAVSGYTYPYINKDVLRKTLPYLTYITVFNYRITLEGDLIDIDDTEIIQIAKEYGVAPMMLISTLTEKGVGSSEIAANLVAHPDIQDKLSTNVINKLKEKGYYGCNLYLQYIRQENLQQVEEYIKRVSERLRAEGFRIILTVTPRTNIEGTVIEYEQINYTTLSKYVDGILFLSYDWAYSYGPPASATPMNIVKDILNNLIMYIPPEKLFLGIPVIGYDWQLPYIPGYTVARAITNDVAIELAVLANAEIQYNEIAQAPYFFYTNELKELHIVWFKDARSIDALAELIPQYGLQGMSIWNIMRFFAQLWFVVNNQYTIEKVENVNKPFT
ncbi:MAG TPA: LysM peptidoglycan-binding domain-containing protein [Mobilitalea sp.]|nr:LysM peptidoglycan-binding domain-containing protein [Mobilitalea sp.]